MTKMQIIAKTILTVLGIYAVVTLYDFYPARYTYSIDEPSTLLELVFLSGFTIFVATVAYFMIFSNDRLSRKMAGPGQQLDRPTQATWLVKSLRTGLVFAGLMLLPRSVPAIIKILKIPFLIRPAINDILVSKGLPKILMLSYPQWFRNIYDFLKAILAVYLICGAPRFIRWQLKHTRHRQAAAEQIKFPGFSITNSERTDDE